MWFNPLKKPHPRKPQVYAVTAGTYVGELLVYMEDTQEDHVFLSLPTMVNRSIPKDKFKIGLEGGIVDPGVDKLPSKVYKVCEAQYNKNKKAK